MSCLCEIYTCVEAKWNPCSEGALLAIEATETGFYSAEIEFNGMWSSLVFGVTDGENIIFPTEFLNEFYTHELKIYDSAGELLNDTCYKLKSRMMASGGTYSPIPPTDITEILEELAELQEEVSEIQEELEEVIYSVKVEGVGTHEVESNELLDNTAVIVDNAGQSYTTQDWTQSGIRISFNELSTALFGTVEIFYKKT